MAAIGIFFGSTTGNTENVAEKIQNTLGSDNADLYDIASATPDNIVSYKHLIFGVSTWGDGELQEDWNEFVPHLENIDFSGKKVALFGLGDQEGYPDTFVDALGILFTKVKNKGAAIIGSWSSESYSFDSSEAFIDGSFAGLVLDEDNQSDLTDDRLKRWLDVLTAEFR